MSRLASDVATPPRIARARSRRGRPFAALATAVVVVTASACGGDDTSSTSTVDSTAATPTTDDAPATTASSPATTGGGTVAPEGDALTRTATTCSQIFNSIDTSVIGPGSDASIEILFHAVKDQEPTSEDLQAWKSALEPMVALRDDVAAQLAAVTGTPDDEAWSVVVDAARVEADNYRARLSAVSDGWHPDTVRPAETVDVEDALTTMGLFNRDCATVIASFGDQVDLGSFPDEAATVCTAIVNRRYLDDFAGTTDVVLDAVFQSYEHDEVAVTPELTAAVDAALTEWRQTLADLESLTPPDDADAAAEWQVVLDWARDRVSGFERRADAIASGDQTELLAVFKPGAIIGVAGPGDFMVLGLERRDCRSIDA